MKFTTQDYDLDQYLLIASVGRQYLRVLVRYDQPFEPATVALRREFLQKYLRERRCRRERQEKVARRTDHLALTGLGADPSERTAAAPDIEASDTQSRSVSQGGGPFLHWDNAAWDRPVRLLDAIKRWSPQLGRRLDELTGPEYWKWRSSDDIGQAAQERQRARTMYDDHPTSAAMFERKGGGADITAEVMPDTDEAADAEIPGSLRDDLVRLLREWDRWEDKDRVVYATELAGRLVIEKTRQGQPYSLKYATPPSPGDLSADSTPIGGTRHDALRSYDLDLRASTIRNRGGKWLPVRVIGGIEVKAEGLRLARVARQEQEAAASTAWAALRSGKMQERPLFGYDDVADALACKSGSLEIDAAERERILHDLDDWTRRGEFNESDVVILTDEPPYFTPLRPLPPLRPGEVEIPIAPDRRMLRRGASRRYIENSPLDGAARVMREWFPAATRIQSPINLESGPAEHVCEAPEPGKVAPNSRPLTGGAKTAALEGWVCETWASDYSKLPGRDALLSLAREKPEFAKVTQNDVRDIRCKYATQESKRGGALPHRANMVK